MKRRMVLSLLGAAPSMAWAQLGNGSPDFSRYASGRSPPDFETGWRTGQGAIGQWDVIDDASAKRGKAIEQSNTDPTDCRFPLAVYDMPPVQDVDARVRFKAMSGGGDRAGGLAVRLADADNYYVVRANALEDNVNLYRVLKGRRLEIKSMAAKVTSGEWHRLTLKARGTALSVSFDGASLFSVEDDTFSGPGRVALWTKADSVTRFDTLAIQWLS